MSETTTDRKFPREIVFSPGFGAGICTWNDNGYDLVEHPVLVEYVKTTQRDERDAGEIAELLTRAGFNCDDVYWGGLGQAEVTTVNGPYKIDEYDGSESVIESSCGELWRY